MATEACPKCDEPVEIVYVEDYSYDWEGEPERDDDGYELWALYKVLRCDACGHVKRSWLEWLPGPSDDDSGPAT